MSKKDTKNPVDIETGADKYLDEISLSDYIKKSLEEKPASCSTIDPHNNIDFTVRCKGSGEYIYIDANGNEFEVDNGYLYRPYKPTSKTQKCCGKGCHKSRKTKTSYWKKFCSLFEFGTVGYHILNTIAMCFWILLCVLIINICLYTLYSAYVALQYYIDTFFI